MKIKHEKTILDRMVRRQIEAVLSQREEVVLAFIAKYGFEPDRAMQIEIRMPDGSVRWAIRRMSDDEMAALP